jgi:hypothetical protein
MKKERAIGTKFDALIEQVRVCMANAPDAELQKLSVMLSQYEDQYSVTWNGIRKQPAARKLLDAICEEAHGMPHAGFPRCS